MESASSVALPESGAAQGKNASAAAGGDGDDGGGVGHVPHALGLANEAADFFKAGRYQECVGALNQLLQKKPGDVKVGGGGFKCLRSKFHALLFLFLWIELWVFVKV